jgi:hypothetical protein
MLQVTHEILLQVNSVLKSTSKYASSSRRGKRTTMHMVEEEGELGNSKGVMIWLRFSCDVMSEVKEKPHTASKLDRLCSKQDDREERSAKLEDPIGKVSQRGGLSERKRCSLPGG